MKVTKKILNGIRFYLAFNSIQGYLEVNKIDPWDVRGARAALWYAVYRFKKKNSLKLAIRKVGIVKEQHEKD